jgi:hypothetical protein
MDGNRIQNEISLLEELMKDKETIFRQEIKTLKETIHQLETRLLENQK